MYKGPDLCCGSTDCRRSEPVLSPEVEKGLKNLKAIKRAYYQLIQEGIPSESAAVIVMVAAAFR